MKKLIRLIFLVILLIGSSLGATRTWSSTGSTDACDGNNYTPTGSISSTDSLVLNATSSINWIPTSSLDIRAITVSSYTGAITVAYPVTTVKRQWWAGTGSVNFTDGKFTITGDNAKFYLDLFSSFNGTRCTLDILGATDTIYINKDISGSSIQQYYFAYLGKTTYLFTPNTVVCYHNTHLKGGIGYLLGRYWMVDPDTTHPFSIDGLSWWNNSGFQGPFITRNNPNVHIFYFPRWWLGAHMTFRYSPVISTYDTVFFTDTLRAGSIRFNSSPSNKQSITFILQNYCSVDKFETFGSDSSYHTIICSNDNNNRLNLGMTTFIAPTRFYMYLNNCQNILTYGWNFSSGSASSFIDAGTSTVLMRTSMTFVPTTKIDSSRFNGYPLYNVICSTGIGGGADTYMRFKDSLHCKNNLTLKGDVRFINQYPIKIQGVFSDSLLDTCKLSSVYLGNNGYLSNQSVLLWYPGSKITAIGNNKQYIYSNGNILTDIVVKQGSKLTVK